MRIPEGLGKEERMWSDSQLAKTSNASSIILEELLGLSAPVWVLAVLLALELFAMLLL
jgi:hypothetical protein